MDNRNVNYNDDSSFNYGGVNLIEMTEVMRGEKTK